MSTDSQGTKRRRKIAENFNRLSRARSARTLQTTGGLAIAYSERERVVHVPPPKKKFSEQNNDKAQLSPREHAAGRSVYRFNEMFYCCANNAIWHDDAVRPS